MDAKKTRQQKKPDIARIAAIALLILALFLYVRKDFRTGGELSTLFYSLIGQGTVEPSPVVPVPDPAPEPEPDPSPQPDPEPDPEPDPQPVQTSLDEHGSYDSKEDVALFIHTYGRLPDNYITKEEAEALGWTGGSVEKYAPGKCIGGTYFGNYEGLLPKKKGRSYYECDIGTLGKSSRGAKRIIYSNDGLVYYTDDHYESFELLYGKP